MECDHSTVHALSGLLLIGGALFLLNQLRRGPSPYGRYARKWGSVHARWGWLLQELPAFLVPVLMASITDGSESGRRLLLCTFTLHYFHRALVYPFLVRGRPMPMSLVVFAAVFCLLNGFLQSHALLHCYPPDQDRDRDWVYSLRTTAGLCLFVCGMVMNIHSDHILKRLRRPGETTYRIPRGGLFELVSGANYLAEMLEWWGFALAAWTLPAVSFAVFTVCSIGPRALGHHRFYLEKFPDYPRTRKALIPFIL